MHTALSLAVENVGETMDRAFFQCSSCNTVSPYSKGPDMPGRTYREIWQGCQERQQIVHSYSSIDENMGVFNEHISKNIRIRDKDDRSCSFVNPMRSNTMK